MRRKQCVNVLLYDYLYLTSRHLRRSMVQTFILSAKTTQPSVLTYFEYEPTAFPGVYRSRDKWLKLIDLLILNELSNEPTMPFLSILPVASKLGKRLLLPWSGWRSGRGPRNCGAR